MNTDSSDARELSQFAAKYLALSAEVRDQYRRVFSESRAVFDEWEQLAAPLVEARNQIAATFEHVWGGPSFNVDGAVTASAEAQAAMDRVRTGLVELSGRLTASIQPAYAEFQTSISAMPAETRKALAVLGDQGWYLDLGMTVPELWEVKEAFESGEIPRGDAALCTYFDLRLSAIEETLTAALPRRAHLIRSALKAHRGGEYELAIPVLLAQVDGTCKDLASEYFFLRRNHRPQLADYVEQLAADSFRGALLAPLVEALPVRASYGDESGSSSELNRHRVLHGHDVNYGTRINSFKSISLLNYVAGVLSRPELS